MVIEARSTRSYPDHVRDDVLVPLGMTRSSADPRAVTRPDLAQGHSRLFGFAVARDAPVAPSALGYGGATSTARDLARLLLALARGGELDGVRVLSPASVRAMRTPPPGVVGTGYGFGWAVGTTDGVRVGGHDGAAATSSGAVVLLPDRNRGFVLLVDSQHLLDHWFGLAELTGGVTALLADRPPPGGVPGRLVGLTLLAVFGAVLAGAIRGLLRLARWRERSRNATRGRLVRDVAPHLVMPALLLVGAYVVVPRLVDRPFTAGWVGHGLTRRPGTGRGSWARTGVLRPCRWTPPSRGWGRNLLEGAVMSRVNATDVPVTIEVAGDRHPGIEGYAEKRVRAALRVAHRPVLHVRVRITHHEDPAVAKPVVAQADVDVNGRVVLAQATGTTGLEAVDLLHDRLRRRLERDRSRSGGHWEDRRGAHPSAEAGGWRHGEHPATPLPEPETERVVVPHRSVTPLPCGLDEAVFDMEAMGYDFHLFTEEGSGQDSVVYTSPDGLRLAQVEPRPDEMAPHLVPVTVSGQPAPVLGITEAIDQLRLWDRPFLFFLDAERGRGAVLHHRHDGHYGLVSPAR